MRRRRREHSLLLKASKILVSLGASVNLALSYRRRALRSFPLRRRGAAGSAAPAARNADATSPRREIGVGISPQVELGVSAFPERFLGRLAPVAGVGTKAIPQSASTQRWQSGSRAPASTRGAIAPMNGSVPSINSL